MVAAFGQLEQLVLDSDAEVVGVRLAEGFSRLDRLQQLAMGARASSNFTLDLDPGCLPPGLQQLSVQFDDDLAQRPALSGARALRGLHLTGCCCEVALGDCAGQLTALTALSLISDCYIPGLPQELSALTQLQRLVVPNTMRIQQDCHGPLGIPSSRLRCSQG